MIELTDGIRMKTQKAIVGYVAKRMKPFDDEHVIDFITNETYVFIKKYISYKDDCLDKDRVMIKRYFMDNPQTIIAAAEKLNRIELANRLRIMVTFS